MPEFFKICVNLILLAGNFALLFYDISVHPGNLRIQVGNLCFCILYSLIQFRYVIGLFCLVVFQLFKLAVQVLALLLQVTLRLLQIIE